MVPARIVGSLREGSEDRDEKSGDGDPEHALELGSYSHWSSPARTLAPKSVFEGCLQSAPGALNWMDPSIAPSLQTKALNGAESW